MKNRGRTNNYTFPLHTTLETQGNDRHDAAGATKATHNQNVWNKKYKNNSKKKYLFHGRDMCFIHDNGTIKIKNGGIWKEYGGGDDGNFRYGDIVGTEAKEMALMDVKRYGNS